MGLFQADTRGRVDDAEITLYGGRCTRNAVCCPPKDAPSCPRRGRSSTYPHVVPPAQLLLQQSPFTVQGEPEPAPPRFTHGIVVLVDVVVAGARVVELGDGCVVVVTDVVVGAAPPVPVSAAVAVPPGLALTCIWAAAGPSAVGRKRTAITQPAPVASTAPVQVL